MQADEVVGGVKQHVHVHVGGEVCSDQDSSATADSGRGPSEDSTAPTSTDDGTRTAMYHKYISHSVILSSPRTLGD